MRVIGRGLTALKKFCGIMDLPPPVAWPAFNGHQKAIAQAAAQVSDESIKLRKLCSRRIGIMERVLLRALL